MMSLQEAIDLIEELVDDLGTAENIKDEARADCVHFLESFFNDPLENDIDKINKYMSYFMEANLKFRKLNQDLELIKESIE